MDSFRIRGGARLKGRVEISGSKNSALPIVAACLMAEGKTTLHGVPRLSDINSMTKLVGELGANIRRHDPTSKTVGDGPDLNGPLDIEVIGREAVRGPVRHRQDDAGQHLRAGAAAGQAGQGDRQHPRRVRDRRPAGRPARAGAAEAGGRVHHRGREHRRHRPRPAAGLPAVPGRGPGADRAGHDQRHVRRRTGRGRDGAGGRRLRAGGGRLRRPAEQDGGPHPRPRHAGDPHRGRRQAGRRRPPHHPRPDRGRHVRHGRRHHQRRAGPAPLQHGPPDRRQPTGWTRWA